MRAVGSDAARTIRAELPDAMKQLRLRPASAALPERITASRTSHRSDNQRNAAVRG
jgi:hypothetical protein